MSQKTDGLDALLKNLTHVIMSSLRVSMPVRVVSFNPEPVTVTVEPMIQQVLENGEALDLPVLVDVPVEYPRGGGFACTFPLQAGDEGWVVFGDRCIDGWWESGEKSRPLDPRMHDLSDAKFTPGASSKVKAINNIYMGGISLRTDDDQTHIRLSNGKIYIKGDIKHEGDHEQTGDMERTGTSTTTGLITGQGGMSVKGGSGTSFEGNVTHTGGAMQSNGVTLDKHTHSGVQTGGGNTGAPNK